AGGGRLEVDSSVAVLMSLTAGDTQDDGGLTDVVLSGGTLSGAGKVGRILGAGASGPAGTIDPGDNGTNSPYGKLTTNGSSTTLGSNTTLLVDLNSASAGAGAGYDQLVVDGGAFAPNGATLAGLATANVASGDTFTIVKAVNGGRIGAGNFAEPFGPGVVFVG